MDIPKHFTWDFLDDSQWNDTLVDPHGLPLGVFIYGKTKIPVSQADIFNNISIQYKNNNGFIQLANPVYLAKEFDVVNDKISFDTPLFNFLAKYPDIIKSDNKYIRDMFIDKISLFKY